MIGGWYKRTLKRLHYVVMCFQEYVVPKKKISLDGRLEANRFSPPSRSWFITEYNLYNLYNHKHKIDRTHVLLNMAAQQDIFKLLLTHQPLEQNIHQLCLWLYSWLVWIIPQMTVCILKSFRTADSVQHFFSLCPTQQFLLPQCFCLILFKCLVHSVSDDKLDLDLPWEWN